MPAERTIVRMKRRKRRILVNLLFGSLVTLKLNKILL
jgi:hypothetical protein